MAKTFGRKMEEVPRSEWPFFTALETVPLRVWQSKDYLAVLYQQKADGMRRLAVNSTRKGPCRKRRNGTDWRDGITWDELQRIKNETIGPETWCVEVYPAQDKLVDVANIRHLWLLDEPPATRFPEKPVTDVDGILDAIRSAIGGSR